MIIIEFKINQQRQYGKRQHHSCDYLENALCPPMRNYLFHAKVDLILNLFLNLNKNETHVRSKIIS